MTARPSRIARSQRARHRLGLAFLIAGGLAVGGCVSSTDIDALHDQIADVQRQATLLQQQGSSKQEVAQLESTKYLQGIIIGLVITFFAGYIPAKKAANVDPVEILRR